MFQEQKVVSYKVNTQPPGLNLEDLRPTSKRSKSPTQNVTSQYIAQPQPRHSKYRSMVEEIDMNINADITEYQDKHPTISDRQIINKSMQMVDRAAIASYNNYQQDSHAKQQPFDINDDILKETDVVEDT